jgi:acyl carrier protein
MSRGEILEGVRKILEVHLSVREPVSEASDLTADLQLDSLGLLTLVVEIENEFRICFDGDDESGIVRIGDLVDRIERHTAAGKEHHD